MKKCKHLTNIYFTVIRKNYVSVIDQIEGPLKTKVE